MLKHASHPYNQHPFWAKCSREVITSDQEGSREPALCHPHLPQSRRHRQGHALFLTAAWASHARPTRSRAVHERGLIYQQLHRSGPWMQAVLSSAQKCIPFPLPPPLFFFLNIKLKWEAGQGKQKEGPKGVVELEWFLTCVQIICKLTPVMAFLQRGRNIQQSVCKGIWILMDIMSAYSILTDCDVLELLKKSCQS